MTYFISRMIFKIILHALGKFEVMGKENLPKKGPFIMASNHVSLADPAAVGVACNTMSLIFMAKKELFELNMWGWWFKAMGCIPVRRESGNFQVLKKAVEKLREGKAIAIFPEGKRSSDGTLQKAEPGIGFLAVKSKAPIVPVYVSGTDKLLPKGEKFIKPNKVIAKIGKRINITDAALPSERRKVYEAIGEKTMAVIRELKNE